MIMVTIMIIFVSMVITTIIIIVYNYDDHYGDHYDYHHHPIYDEWLSEYIVDGLSWSSIHDWSREREEIWTTGKIEAHDTWLWLIDW